MKLSDLFVPKYLHSKAEVRTKAVNNLNDINLLNQISEKDDDAGVREAASIRANELKQAQDALLSK